MVYKMLDGRSYKILVSTRHPVRTNKKIYDIYQEHDSHTTKYFSYNMKNEKARWCAICEVKTHPTIEFQLKLKNRHNYHAIYQTNAIN